MLILGSRLINRPVMGLQTGGELARTTQPIIDPASLSIVAYRVVSPLLVGTTSYMRIEDARELSDIGFIIDSIDELVAPGDVIKLDDIASYRFDVIHMHVRDEKGKKIGKVVDYTIDVESFYVQQLTVHRPLLKSLSEAELVVHRSQIIEINDDAIVIHSKAEVPEHTRLTSPGSYINPFRDSSPAADSIDPV